MGPEVPEPAHESRSSTEKWLVGGIVWMLVVIAISLIASSITRNALLSGYGKSREIRELSG